jgi:alpha-galactosidase
MRPVALLLLAAAALSAQSIQFDENRKVWLLNTRVSSYAMGISPEGELQHLYWGGPLWRIADVPAARTRNDISSFDPHEMLENEEFAGWGGKRFYETALKITRADGDRDLVLHYQSQQVDGDRLSITLKDIKDDIEAVVEYHVWGDAGIVSRRAVIRNKSKGDYARKRAIGNLVFAAG